MKNTYKWITLVIVVAFIVLVVAANYDKQGSKILIGAVLPQTGFGAYWGGPVLKGVLLAEKDLQEKYGDIGIVVEDGKSDAAASASAAQKLINVDGVGAVYTEFSGPSNAISPIAKAAGKPIVYSTFNQKIVETNENSLKTFISYQTVCDQFAEYIKKPSAKVLIISAIADAASYCKSGLLEHLSEGNIKLIEGFTSKDFRTLLLQNKEFGADYILPIMYEDGAFALIKQKYEIGIPGSIFGYKQDVVTDKIIQELPKEMTEGIIFFTIPIKESFVQKVKDEYPNVTNDDIQGIANAYQSVMILGESLMGCKENESKCMNSYASTTKNIEYGAYVNARLVNRVLYSDINLGIVRGGVPTTN